MKTRVFGLLTIFIILVLLFPLQASAKQQPEPALPAIPVSRSISETVSDNLGKTETPFPAIITSIPSPINLYVGQTKTISIWVEDAADVNSYYVRLYFDPSLVQILDADPNSPGVQVQDGDFFYPPQSITTANWVDNSSGVVTYINFFIEPTMSISGSGKLLSFDLQAIDIGTSTINMTQSYLISPMGDILPTSILNPQIYINAPLNLYLPIVVGGGS
jgi:hypothetical protein